MAIYSRRGSEWLGDESPLKSFGTHDAAMGFVLLAVESQELGLLDDSVIRGRRVERDARQHHGQMHAAKIAGDLHDVGARQIVAGFPQDIRRRLPGQVATEECVV